MRDMDFIKDMDSGKWECPPCNFCGSAPETHVVIFENVKDTGHALVECPTCRLRFYSPRLPFSAWLEMGYGTSEASRLEAERYAENTSFFVVEDKEEQARNVRSYYNYMLNKFIAIVGLPESMFEVAGATGFFMNCARDLGVKEFAGCEVNLYDCKIAKEKYGFDITHSEFKAYAPAEKLFDCGVMLDYIEHSYHPFDDLKKISGMTKPGGSLLLKTFLEELDVNRTMEAPLGHANHFYGDTLKAMIDAAGYDVVGWELEGIMVIAAGKKRV